MTGHPFSLTVFVPSGEAHGVRVISKSGWVGVAVAFRADDFGEALKREELRGPGVYILWDREEVSPKTPVYVGESDRVEKRLKEQVVGKHKATGEWDWFTDVVAFMSKDDSLNKADVRYLEASLWSLAKRGRRCVLINKVEPRKPKLSDVAEAGSGFFLANLLECLPLLGLTAFQDGSGKETQEGSPLHLTARFPKLGVEAQAHRRAEGFVVMAGSQARGEVAPALKKFFPGICRLRDALIEQGILVQDGSHFRFSQDYAFGGHNPATAVIKGGVGPGVKEVWKDERGRTLKEMMEGE